MFIVGTTKQLSKITYILYTYPEGFKKTTKKKTQKCPYFITLDNGSVGQRWNLDTDVFKTLDR